MRLLRKHSIGLTSTEFDYLDGVTSGIQTQMDGKAPLASPTFTGTVAGVTATHVGLGNATNESKATMFTSPTFTGNVLSTGQPCFQMQVGSSQSSPATGATIVFSTERFDVGSDFTGNTFTAPVTGKYLFSWCIDVQVLDKDNTGAWVELITSNHTYQYILLQDPAGFDEDPTYWPFVGSLTCDLDASDTAYLTWNFSSGVTCDAIRPESYWSGVLIC